MKIVNPSTIKLEKFNDCPGKEAMQAQMDEMYLGVIPNIVDTDAKYWVNNADTLVLAFPPQDGMLVALNVAKLAVEALADEFEYNYYDGKYIVRLWWD